MPLSRIGALGFAATCLMLSTIGWRQLGAASCELSQIVGGVDIAVNPDSGDLIVVAQGLRIFRSTDGGSSYSHAWLGIDGSWPSIAFRGGELFVAAGRWGEPNEVFLLYSADGGASFGAPRVVFTSSPNRLIDPELLVLRDGRLLLFLTEVYEPIPDLVAFTVHMFRSSDDGWSWQQLPDPVASPLGTVRIEDAKALELEDGTVLLAYEYELEDQAASRIEQIRSLDGGSTWQAPTVIWDDVPGSDDEPGGYVPLGPDRIWFLASTDEDALDAYDAAVVKRKVSADGGLQWLSKATLVSDPDQIVYGGAVTASGTVVLATVRFHTGGPRRLFVYHVDPGVPGPWTCAPLIFVDGLEAGHTDRWSATVP